MYIVLVIAFCAILCEGRSKSPLIDEDQGAHRRDKAAGNFDIFIFFSYQNVDVKIISW